MKKFVKIIELNQKIIDTQKSVVEKLKNIFPEAQVEAVGSIAVPMTGRSEIDIMVIVNKKDLYGLPEENYKRQKSEWIRKNILSKKETFYGTNDGTDVWAEDIV